MKIRSIALVLSLILGAGFILTIGQRDRHEPRILPPAPTEHILDDDAERENKLRRKQYMDLMHYAAPGTDWRAIERANGLALQAARAHWPRESNRWNEIGSRNLAGRMHCASLSLSGDSLYGGSSRGGIWKGTVNGDGWRPISDNLWGGAHGLAIAGGDPEVINRVTDSGDIHYSDDGGDTWQRPAGLPAEFSECKRIMTDPTNPNRVYLLARPPGPYKILYRSDNAGRSYSEILSLGWSAGDFWLDRVEGGDIYVMSRATLRRSADHGETWEDLGTAVFLATSRVVLTASEAGAPTFYAAIKIGSDWDLHRSTDGGWTWEERFEINDFWETLCASINNPDLIVFAGVECWRSPNGGANFFKVNNWWDYYSDPVNKFHADFPGLECIMVPGEGESFFAATDGGLYRCNETMTLVTNISLTGLGVSQYYDIHTSVEDPNLMLAGSQDQGYQRSEGPDRGPTWDFVQLISGDYGHLTSSDGTHDVVFSVYPGFVLLQEGSDTPVLRQLDFPAGESHLWLPPIVANPENTVEFYFCGRHIQLGHWYGGESVGYTPVSPDLTVEGGSYVSALSISPVDLDRRIAVTNSGEIWYSHDHGNTWHHSPANGPSSHYFYGNAIVHSHVDPDRAWIGGSGYSGPGVYRTDDGGVSWVTEYDGLPSTLVYGLAIESPETEVLYAATESGPYRLDPDTETWEYIGGTEVPLTTYWCVEAVPAAETVRFGTYGRGIWEYRPGPLTAVAEGEAPGGTRFTLAAYPNPFNPRTTLRFKLDEEAEVELALYDVSGRRVRVLAAEKFGAGMHERAWAGRDDRGRECPSGLYMARVEGEGANASLRLTLLR